MLRLVRPVTKIISVMPASTASSTAYWINGLSTTGIISLGLALVAGKNREPIPATGKTALRTFSPRLIWDIKNSIERNFELFTALYIDIRPLRGSNYQF